MVGLKEITWDNFWSIISLKPTESQMGNLPSNAIFMAQAYINLKMHYNDVCFAIYNDDEPVGFTKIVFVEKNEETYKFLEDTYFIDAMMIDEKHQGKGYSKPALKQILDFIQTKPWGDTCSIKLSIYDGNTAAANLCKQFGFVSTDEFVLGKAGLRLYVMKQIE